MSASSLPPDFNPAQYARQPKPKQTNWLVVGLIGGAGVMLLLCCGGGLWLANFGLDVITVEIEQQLRDHPDIVEHIGNVESFEMDFVKSTAHPHDDFWVYEVVGSKGRGELTVHHVTNDNDEEEIISASLRMSDGTTIKLEM